MSNHYHVVLRADKARALALDDDAVLRRSTHLFTGPLLVQRYLSESSESSGQMGPTELEKVHEFAELYRQRFLPVLASAIAPQTAPQATPENIDENTLQPLQILPGLLSETELAELPEAPLMPFDVTSRFEQAISFGLKEYLELVDTMGRALHPAKRGVCRGFLSVK